MYYPIIVSTRHADAPWIAAHLAVLNEAAVDVRLDIDFQLLTAIGARHQELVWHSGNPTALPLGVGSSIGDAEVRR